MSPAGAAPTSLSSRRSDLLRQRPRLGGVATHHLDGVSGLGSSAAMKSRWTVRRARRQGDRIILSQCGNRWWQTVDVGHFRPIRPVSPAGSCPLRAPIVLQKSKVAGLRIFAKNPKREAIANSYNLNRASEVAYEFNVGRCGPSHLYTKSAPVALRIFKHRCKTTFATQSPESGRAFAFKNPIRSIHSFSVVTGNPLP